MVALTAGVAPGRKERSRRYAGRGAPTESAHARRGTGQRPKADPERITNSFKLDAFTTGVAPGKKGPEIRRSEIKIPTDENAILAVPKKGG